MEVLSTGVWDTAVVELSTAMPATPTVLDILSFQHMANWNRHVTTATSGVDLIYNDAGTIIFGSTVTEPDANSFERAQFSTV